MTQLSLFYVPELSDSGQIRIEGDLAHHMAQVLRMKAGDEFWLSDGKGAIAVAKAVEVSKKFVLVSCEKPHHHQQKTPQLVVVQAIPKSERVKECIELMVQAGVDQIYPWQAMRCIGKLNDQTLGKWSNYIESAGAQSRRAVLPVVHSVVSPNAIAEVFTEQDLILICHESAPTGISKTLTQIENIHGFERICVVIGPEGGIDPSEIEKLSSLTNAYVVSLGDIVFRSAHAAMPALSTLQIILGRW
jgi:16S rRNA (uracil1498-N3)-methyltransferase